MEERGNVAVINESGKDTFRHTLKDAIMAAGIIWLVMSGTLLPLVLLRLFFNFPALKESTTDEQTIITAIVIPLVLSALMFISYLRSMKKSVVISRNYIRTYQDEQEVEFRLISNIIDMHMISGGFKLQIDFNGEDCLIVSGMAPWKIVEIKRKIDEYLPRS